MLWLSFRMLGRRLHSPAGYTSLAGHHAQRTRSRRLNVSVRAANAAPPPQVQILENSSRNTNEPPPTTQAAAEFLRQELKTIFRTGEITASRYARGIVFEDPITRISDINAYQLMIRAIKTLFNVTFDLHDVTMTKPDEVTTTWTMSLKAWELPWQPTLLFSGRSFYKVDSGGTIISHRDVWDSVDNNAFLSPEAVAEVLRQLLQLQITPDLETPAYTVLKATRDYELRRYQPYIVAETAMPSGSTPAGGAGFNDLAGYIFGGNSNQQSMEMTTPVFTRSPAQAAAGEGSSGSGEVTMQFVLEKKFADVDELPQPNSRKVRRKQLPGSFCAAARFSGFAFDWEVKDAERKLRSALAKAGLRAKPGYSLARYNEPWVPPPLRRNEVLLELVDFEWP